MFDVQHGGSLARPDPDAVVPGEVDHRVTAAHRLDDRGRPRQVARSQFHPEVGESAGATLVADDRDDAVTPADEATHDGKPDEPGPAGHDDLHQGRPRGSRGLSTP